MGESVMRPLQNESFSMSIVVSDIHIGSAAAAEGAIALGLILARSRSIRAQYASMSTSMSTGEISYSDSADVPPTRILDLAVLNRGNTGQLSGSQPRACGQSSKHHVLPRWTTAQSIACPERRYRGVRV
jgi:hypothetical protein